ncbi:hypothetical protein GCM10020256_66900 [Streptomyces thermocoprophilus]
MSATPRGRRSAVLAAAVTTAAALGAATLVTLGAGSASAAEVPLSGYELTWGIKQSYRTYVTTYAAGGFTATDGASQAAGNGAFTFTGGKGGYDSTAHTLKLGFDGSLRIVSEQHGFDITLSDVRFDSGAGAITADVTRSGTTEQGRAAGRGHREPGHDGHGDRADAAGRGRLRQPELRGCRGRPGDGCAEDHRVPVDRYDGLRIAFADGHGVRLGPPRPRPHPRPRRRPDRPRGVRPRPRRPPVPLAPHRPRRRPRPRRRA